MKGLPEHTTDDSLRALFAPFGEVLSATAPLDSYGKSRGYGFVSYGSVEEATKAVSQMHLHVLHGRAIHVDLAESKQDREKRAERLQQRDMRLLDLEAEREGGDLKLSGTMFIEYRTYRSKGHVQGLQRTRAHVVFDRSGCRCFGPWLCEVCSAVSKVLVGFVHP